MRAKDSKVGVKFKEKPSILYGFWGILPTFSIKNKKTLLNSNSVLVVFVFAVLVNKDFFGNRIGSR